MEVRELEQVLVRILCVIIQFRLFLIFKINLENKENKDSDLIEPYYEGFKGQLIIKITSSKYLIKGIYSILANSVHITELPIGTWTDDYKQYLETLIDGKKGKKKGEREIKQKKDLLLKIMMI